MLIRNFPQIDFRDIFLATEFTEGFTENGTTQITSKVNRRGTNGDPSFLRETNGWLWSPLFASLRNEASQRSKL
jgi:hypothetical protein